MEDLIVALSQSAFRLDDPQANLLKAAGICEDATRRGAKVVAFPETALTGSIHHLPGNPDLHRHAVVLPGEESDALAGVAKSMGIAIVMCTFEAGEEHRLYNSSFVVTADGFQGVYRKIFPAPSEAGLTTPGKDTPVFELFGWKFGIGICCDLYLPEVARFYALKGAEVFLVPTGGTGFAPQQIDDPLLKPVFNRAGFMKICPARALDNGMYVLLPVASDAGGGSVAVDPNGEQLLGADGEEDLLLVTLSRNRYNRANTPYLTALRAEIYQALRDAIDA